MKIEGEIIMTHCTSCRVYTNQLVRAKYKPNKIFKTPPYCRIQASGH